ncbi:MAG: hypothetical protein ACTSR8_16545 [Promethearchaeota archaeon]
MSEEEKYNPKFMEWGIINKDNYRTISEVPIKRWDPLSTVNIKSKDFGLQKKQIRHYGHYSYISPIRSKRPMSFRDTGKKKVEIEKAIEKRKIIDVFAAETEGAPLFNEDGSVLGDAYTIIITQDEAKRDNPFSNRPHRIEKLPETCKAVTLINRYPTMVRVIDSEIKNEILQNLPFNSKLATGINLITISRHFYPALDFEQIPSAVLSSIFSSMKAAILFAVEEAIERDYYDITVNPFFNIGALVGGSQPRIHSQVYLDLNGDGHGTRLDNYLNAFKEMGKNCHLCDSFHGGGLRIVLDSEYWIFFATGSPARNYHLRFNPKEHIRRFTQLNTLQIIDLAKSLKIIFRALDELKIDQNRNILFNCCPYGYDADFHLFGDIIPHEIIGGAEMADDMRVARLRPEVVAEEIRKVIKDRNLYNL